MLDKMLEKITSVFGETSDYGVSLEKSGALKKAREFLRWHHLSDLLPYESYDEENGVFINYNGYAGFVFEVGLYLGSEESLENELSALFKNILPNGSSIQFLFSASDKISHILDYWRDNKAKISDVVEEMLDTRVEFFKNLGTANTFRIRDFRGIVSVSFEVGRHVNLSKVKELKTQIKSVFETRGQKTRELDAKELINFLGDILNLNHSSREWNKYQSLSSQIVDKGNFYTLNEDSLCLEEKEFRFLSISRYPQFWSFGKMQEIIGDSLNDYLKIPCPFLISYGVHIEPSKFKKTKMLAKASRVEWQANTPLGKWIPAIRREAEEWGFVREQLEKNERLVKTHFQVMLMGKSTTEAEQVVKSLYRSKGWELERDRFVIMSSLISMLPMSWGFGMYNDMSYLKKTKTTLSHEPINLLPLQGEFKGTMTPGLLLTGRLGQLFYWYPFDEGMGNTNYNVSIVGRSGSGKSVFMQELASSILSQNGRVYVLDVGRSFEKQVKLFDGQFLEFSTKTDLCLNPFTNIDSSNPERVQDSLSVLKPIIAMMAAPKAGTTDYEDSLLSKCLNEIWNKLGKDAGISDIAEWFLGQEIDQETCIKLGTMLFPYTRSGPYGRFFNGKANIDFNSNFFVIELEELKSRPDLQSVVVQIIMLLITNHVILGGRKVHSGLMFDEAWDVLKGGQSGEFIERLARTLRKYKGALIVGTQTLNDFYSSSAAEAAFMNSDWLCMFSQKAESIALLLKADKFRIDPYTQKVLNSINTKPGEYAEMMIMGPNGSSVGRLLLDPFSRVLYSTKAEEYSRIKELEGIGYTLNAAVTQVARERYGAV